MTDLQNTITSFTSTNADSTWLEAKSADCKWLCQHFGHIINDAADVVILGKDGALLFQGTRAGAGKFQARQVQMLKNQARKEGKTVREVQFRQFKAE